MPFYGNRQLQLIPIKWQVLFRFLKRRQNLKLLSANLQIFGYLLRIIKAETKFEKVISSKVLLPFKDYLARHWHNLKMLSAATFWLPFNPLNFNGFIILVWYNELWIVHCTYLGVSGYNLKKKNCILCLKIFFTFANSVDPDQMPH